MADVKSLLFFMVGLAVFLAVMFGLAWLVMRFGLLFIVIAYAVCYVLILVGFLAFTPGLVRGLWGR